jgi:hypothetical protein
MLGVILGVSILVMLIDFQIKGAILEESARLRGVIDGQRTARSNNNGASGDAPKHAPFPSDVLGEQPSRLEKGNASNGTARSVRGQSKRGIDDGSASDNT